jgi:Protein of unknown function (DUF3631)/Bifunctional DNA primase/polymerase, N-terminal
MTAADVTMPREDDPGATDQNTYPDSKCGPPNKSGHAGGYAHAYPIYDQWGWPNSLKLQRGKKWPPPKGFTGEDGATPCAEQKAQWAREEPYGNIAQRLPETYIGIDVDHYGDKRGGDTLTEAERRWGPLPPTHVSTSRPDGVSGIRIYRKPEGVKLDGNITFRDLGLGDVEIIQYHHRYMMCWPSIHPDTRKSYLWYEPGYSPERIIEADNPPCLSAVSDLPEAWLEGLRVDGKTKSKTKACTTEDATFVECPYIIEQCLTDGEMSDKVVRRLGEATAACYGPSRHDSVLGHVLALLRFGKQGESGVFRAMSALGLTFVKAVADDREGGEADAQAEFIRMLSNEGAARLLSESDGDDKDDSDAASAKAPPAYGSIDGAAVLDKVEAWYRRFIRVTFDGDHALLALWTVHTHLVNELRTTPRLQLDSTMPQSGKTTVLDHFSRLCYQPILMASSPSPALIPRALERDIRTLLFDEVDRTLRPDAPGTPDALAIINSGYRFGATRPVLVPTRGGGWDLAEMSTYSPLVLAGNAPNLPDDTKSRTIRILLMPDVDGSIEDSDWEAIEDEAHQLHDNIAKFAAQVRNRVVGMQVDLPPKCIGRSKEKWRPLKRVAVAAGGRWPEVVDTLIARGLAEDAAEREAGLRALPPGMVLLTDLYAVWPKGRDFMPTLELVDLLVAHNPDYWGQNSPYGKRLTETRLGLMLKQATNSTSTRPGGKGPRGYTLSALQVAWDRLRIGQTDPAITPKNPVNPDNPANPERKPNQPEPDNTGLTEFSACTGLHEKGAEFDEAPSLSKGPNGGFGSKAKFEALRTELLTEYDGPDQDEANGNGEPGVPVLERDTNPVTSGGSTNSTAGPTNRVPWVFAGIPATRANTVISGRDSVAEATVEGDLESPADGRGGAPVTGSGAIHNLSDANARAKARRAHHDAGHAVADAAKHGKPRGKRGETVIDWSEDSGAGTSGCAQFTCALGPYPFVTLGGPWAEAMWTVEHDDDVDDFDEAFKRAWLENRDYDGWHYDSRMDLLCMFFGSTPIERAWEAEWVDALSPLWPAVCEVAEMLLAGGRVTYDDVWAVVDRYRNG